MWIAAHSLPAKLFAIVNYALGIEYLSFVAKTDDPAEEHRGNSYRNCKIEVFRSVRDEHNICAEAINDDVDKLFVETKLYGDLIAVEHLEGAVGIGMKPFSGKLRAGDAGIICYADIAHSV